MQHLFYTIAQVRRRCNAAIKQTSLAGFILFHFTCADGFSHCRHVETPGTNGSNGGRRSTARTWYVFAVEEYVSAMAARLGRCERDFEHGVADLQDVVRETPAGRRRNDADLHTALTCLRDVHYNHSTTAVSVWPAANAARYVGPQVTKDFK